MRLGTKINLVLVTVTVVVLTVAFWVIVGIEASGIKKQVLSDSEVVASLLREDVERMLKVVKEQEAELQWTLDDVKSKKGVEYIHVLNVEGEVTSSTQREMVGKKISPEKYEILKQVVQSGKILDVSIKENDKDFIISFAPVYIEQGNINSKVLAVIEIAVTPKTLSEKDVFAARSLLRTVSGETEHDVRSLVEAYKGSVDATQKITDDIMHFGYYDGFFVFDNSLNIIAETNKNSTTSLAVIDDYENSVKYRKQVLAGQTPRLSLDITTLDGDNEILNIVPLLSVENGQTTILGILEYHVLKSAYTDKIYSLIFRMIAIGLLFTFVLVATLAIILRREVVEPITRYSRIAQKVSEGDLAQTIENLPKGEIGRFGEVFNSMLANLKEFDSIKSGFNSVVAHQLRTPLSGVKWALKLLLDGDIGELTIEQRGMIRHGFETNEKMIRLVDDLLNVSRIENGKFGYNFEPNDFLKLLDEVVNNLAVIAREHNIELSINNKIPALSPFYFDASKISIVLQNVIDNALKYTLPGGRVVVTLNKVGSYLEIKVTDTGVGIPKADIPKIFSKFFRAANVIHLQTDGSGLGLFIVKSIVIRHGGKISIDSIVGKGTTITIELPLLREMLPKQEVKELGIDGGSQDSAIV